MRVRICWLSPMQKSLLPPKKTPECPGYDTEVHLMVKLQFRRFGKCRFGLVCLFNSISTSVGYLMTKSSLYKNRCDTISPIVGWGYTVYNFLKGISLKESIITQPGFELVYYDVAVRYVSHYTTWTIPQGKCRLYLYHIYHPSARAGYDIRSILSGV